MNVHPFPPGALPPLDAGALPEVGPRLRIRDCCAGGPDGTGALGTRPFGAGGGHCGAVAMGCCPCPLGGGVCPCGLRGGHVIGGGNLGCAEPPEGAGDAPAEPPPSDKLPPRDAGRPEGGSFLMVCFAAAAGSVDGCSSIVADDAKDWSLFVAESPSLAVSMIGFSLVRTGCKSANVGYVPSAVTRQPAFSS